MTNREYILEQMRAFAPTESDLLKVKGIDLNAELSDYEVTEKAMIPLLAEMALSPFMKSVNENGFSVSWDIGKMGWLYSYLCAKYGVKPDANVLAALGMSVIIDRTNKW